MAMEMILKNKVAILIFKNQKNIDLYKQLCYTAIVKNNIAVDSRCKSVNPAEENN